MPVPAAAAAEPPEAPTPSGSAAAVAATKRRADRRIATARRAKWDRTRSIYAAGAASSKRRGSAAPDDAPRTPLAPSVKANVHPRATTAPANLPRHHEDEDAATISIKAVLPDVGNTLGPNGSGGKTAANRQRARMEALAASTAPRSPEDNVSATANLRSSRNQTDGRSPTPDPKSTRPASLQRLARLAQPSPKQGTPANAAAKRERQKVIASPAATTATSGGVGKHTTHAASRERLARLSQPVMKEAIAAMAARKEEDDNATRRQTILGDNMVGKASGNARPASRDRLALLSQPTAPRRGPASISADARGVGTGSPSSAKASMSRLVSLARPRQVASPTIPPATSDCAVDRKLSCNGSGRAASKAEYAAAVKAMSEAQEMKNIGGNNTKVFVFNPESLTSS
eukprot:SAG31_NODE_3259_length_4484_cov_2.910376_3_plen_402_part_00